MGSLRTPCLPWGGHVAYHPCPSCTLPAPAAGSVPCQDGLEAACMAQTVHRACCVSGPLQRSGILAQCVRPKRQVQQGLDACTLQQPVMRREVPHHLDPELDPGLTRCYQRRPAVHTSRSIISCSVSGAKGECASKSCWQWTPRVVRVRVCSMSVPGSGRLCLESLPTATRGSG